LRTLRGHKRHRRRERSAQSSISGTLLQVLVVEARPECGHALRDGYTPINEHTVAGAKRRLPDLRPQIVITDFVLSDGNGVDVCCMAKALAHLPLVIVTAPTAEQVPAALKAGCNAVLLRPFFAEPAVCPHRTPPPAVTSCRHHASRGSSGGHCGKRRMWCACLSCDTSGLRDGWSDSHDDCRLADNTVAALEWRH
jgi:CheY-like chemotaxis protein